jgi:L-glyceraldehyde 3-phosphate reductase
MLNRAIERDNLLDTLAGFGAGCIAYSPLQQGLLTDRYLHGVPADSRMRTSMFLSESDLDQDTLKVVMSLNRIAADRGQSLAQLALAWALRDERMTSLIVGASSVGQLEDNLGALRHLDFSAPELDAIDAELVNPL